MSETEFFHGYFRASDLDITESDNDDFYELEEEHGKYFVSVRGTLYEFWRSDLDVDAYGFSVATGPVEHNQLMMMWYNGGAGIHEVAESAIERWLTEGAAQ